jgi:hypothetical protein
MFSVHFNAERNGGQYAERSRYKYKPMKDEMACEFDRAR